MKEFIAGVKRWYERRFKGIVRPPSHAKGQGTTWRQYLPSTIFVICQCGQRLEFTEADLKIMSQDHIEGCEGVFDTSTHSIARASSRVVDLVPCSCPVTEARYVKICPQCHRGHWKQG